MTKPLIGARATALPKNVGGGRFQLIIWSATDWNPAVCANWTVLYSENILEMYFTAMLAVSFKNWVSWVSPADLAGMNSKLGWKWWKSPEGWHRLSFSSMHTMTINKTQSILEIFLGSGSVLTWTKLNTLLFWFDCNYQVFCDQFRVQKLCKGGIMKAPCTCMSNWSIDMQFFWGCLKNKTKILKSSILSGVHCCHSMLLYLLSTDHKLLVWKVSRRGGWGWSGG